MKRSIAACALLAITCAGCAGTPRSGGETIDHLVLAVSDLQRGVDELEQLAGVRAAYGGEHAHGPTHNSLLSLGDTVYLEILAPRAGVALGEYEGLRALARLTPVAWAAATPDAERTIERLEAAGYKASAPQAGSRVKPDGSTLSWRAFAVTSPPMEMAPFFIQWDGTANHPARTSPGGCSLVSTTVAARSTDDLVRLLQLLDLPVTAVAGDKAAMAVTLACGGRKVQLGSVPE